MKRNGQLFEQIASWPNLLLAAAKAHRRKRFRPNVAAFDFDQEYELLRLQRQLLAGSYRPGSYRSFVIHEPKRRLISAAPYRDRVVHHALCNVIEPIFERSYIADSFASRPGKGTHAALDRAAQFARTFPYVLKADIAQFFPSIDHETLLPELRRRVKDPQVMALIETIVRHPFPGQVHPRSFPGDDLFTPLERSCGLPIGNQTSQFFANVMLNPLDQWIKRDLRCRGYVRYADDFLVFGHDKQLLHQQREQIRRFLLDLRLRLHETKSVVGRVCDGVPFLGFRLFPTRRFLGKANLLRFRRRLIRLQRDYALGRVGHEQIRQSIVSWWGHARHARARRLARRILAQYPFRRQREC